MEDRREARGEQGGGRGRGRGGRGGRGRGNRGGRGGGRGAGGNDHGPGKARGKRGNGGWKELWKIVPHMDKKVVEEYYNACSV